MGGHAGWLFGGLGNILARRGGPRVAGLVLLAVASVAFAIGIVACEPVRSRVDDPKPTTQEPDIRVRVKSRLSTATLASGAPSGVLNARILPSGVPAALRSPVQVTISPRGLSTRDAAGGVRDWGNGIDVEFLVPGVTPERTTISMDGTAYPGVMTLRGKWRETLPAFDVVCAMPMEVYIPGVLQKELYDGWPRQAYEAQAIAARSYAMHDRDRSRRGGKLWDVESTTLDQAFGGQATRISAIDAGRNTRGMILTTGGTGSGGVLRAYYSSCCGGRPATAGAIWPTKSGFEFNLASPLQGQPREFACQAAPVFAWEVVRKNDELARRLRAWGRDAGHRLKAVDRLRTVEIAARNAAGRPNSYMVTDVRGQEFRVGAEELRLACNFGVPGAGTTPGQEALADIRSGPSHVKSNDLVIVVAGTDVRIKGRGFGHGVGMCQYCAKGFAERGMDATEMLGIFYPGSTVTRSY